MTRAGLDARGRDDLDQVRHQGKSVGMVRGGRGIRGLPGGGHVTNERDRARGVIGVLGAPGPDRRVVHRAVEREVDLHVPFEVVDERPPTAEPLAAAHGRMVGHVVGDDVPVPRRRLRARSVGPEIGDHTLEIGAVDDDRGVRLAGDRIHRISRAVIDAQRVVEDGAWRYVDELAQGCVQVAAQPDQLHDRILHDRVSRAAEERRRAGIEEEAGRGIPVRRFEGERRDPSPADAHEVLDPRTDGDPVLSHQEVEGQRLPAVRVEEVARAGQLEDERLVDGGIARGVRIAHARALVGAVFLAMADHGRGDPVAEGGGRIAVYRREARVVAERLHLPVERRLGRRAVRVTRTAEMVEGVGGEPLLQHPVGRVADGLPMGDVDRCGGVLLTDQIARRPGIVRGPGVPHGDREVEQVAGVRRRLGQVDPDGREQLLVPDAGDADAARRVAGRRLCGGHALDRGDRDARQEHEGDQRRPPRLPTRAAPIEP